MEKKWSPWSRVFGFFFWWVVLSTSLRPTPPLLATHAHTTNTIERLTNSIFWFWTLEFGFSVFASFFILFDHCTHSSQIACDDTELAMEKETVFIAGIVRGIFTLEGQVE